MLVDLKQHFTAAKIAATLSTASPIHTTIMDELFPEAVRMQVDSPVISVSEISQIVNVVPVVRRGGEPVPITGDGLDNQYIEPLPVRTSAKISGVELNNLKLMNALSRDAWAQRKTLATRQTARLTAEVLCSQAVFNGGISFPLLEANGKYAKYKVDYSGGINTQNVAAEEKWDHESATIMTVYQLLTKMRRVLEQAGCGGETVTYAGTLAFSKLLTMIDAEDKPKVSVQIKEGEIIVGSFRIREMSEIYRDPETGNSRNKLPEKELRMVAKGHTALFYGPVDDLDANLQPLPLFVKPVMDKRLSILELIGESKPLPAVNPKSVCKALVLA